MAPSSLTTLLQHSLRDCKVRIVGIDPGECTGICCFEGPRLLDASQLKTKTPDDGAAQIAEYLVKYQPQAIVIESYRVYAWKTKDHAWNSMHTSQLIGAIKYLCSLKDPPILVIEQTAQIAKGFCTDDKLKAWDLYQKGQRHSRDAIRHAIYYLLFTVVGVHKIPKPIQPHQ
jgi:hypothetical protein